MHDKYSKDGLVVLGVLVGEDLKDAKTRASGVKYLEKQKVGFETLYLDEPEDVWQKKLRINGYPGIYVFNRDNQFVKKLPVLDEKGDPTEEVEYDVVEKAVTNLMKK